MGESFGFHEHAPSYQKSQHSLEAIDGSGISEQST